MGLQSYGIDTTPEELNLWLSQADAKTGATPRGYAGVCDAGLMWGYVPLFVEEKAQAQGLDLRVKWQTTGDANAVLSQGFPVMMQVGGGRHWVLATDSLATAGTPTQGIADPWHSYQCTVQADGPIRSTLQCTQSATPLSLRRATTTVDEIQYQGATVPFRYLAPITAERTPSLQINARHVEILFVDTQGRRTGYDQTSSQIVAEIPNSSYHDGELVPPGKQPSGELRRVLFLAESAAQSFVLRLVSPPGAVGDTPFALTLVGLNAAYDLTKVTSSGRVAAGQVLEYVVEYRQDSTLKITPQGGNPGDPGDTNAYYLPMVR
jgi:hypothetical protein